MAEEKITVKCEHCQSSIEIDDPAFFGEDVECPTCQNPLYVPLPEKGNDDDIGTPEQVVSFAQKKPAFPQNSKPTKVTFPDVQKVAVVDVKMPFWSMVTFMVKWSIASIPAMIILMGLAFVIAFLGGLLLGSLGILLKG